MLPTVVGIEPCRGWPEYSISLSSEDLAWAKRQAQARAKSLSAVVSEALRRQRQAEARLKLLADLGTDDITPVQLAAARAELHAAGPSSKRRVRRRVPKKR